MIIICEPQCKAFSHEKFNSGFLHGLRLAYPQDKILFYADLSHIDAIKRILGQSSIAIGNIAYIPIQFWPTESLAALVRYYWLFRGLFSGVLASGEDKLFLLSFNASILYVIKRLKQTRKFRNIKLTLVCHGAFEDIADDHGERLQLQSSLTLSTKPFMEKIRKVRPSDLLGKIAGAIKRRIMNSVKNCYISVSGFLSGKFKVRLSLKQVLLWRQSADYKYVLLSEHVIVNAAKYLDINGTSFYTIVLPTIFSDPVPYGRNQHVKFAVFGYGYSAMLQKVLAALSLKKMGRSYEIRIIGMDSRGTEGFPNVICPSPGKPLSREEMEKYIPDIDIFLILYDKSLYRLSCSGTIIEALSYIKPILHFDNDCINAFNTDKNPIGMCCDSVDRMALIMEDIINNYQEYVPKLQEYRNNMLALRKLIAIENNLQQLRGSFTW